MYNGPYFDNFIWSPSERFEDDVNNQFYNSYEDAFPRVNASLFYNNMPEWAGSTTTPSRFSRDPGKRMNESTLTDDSQDYYDDVQFPFTQVADHWEGLMSGRKNIICSFSMPKHVDNVSAYKRKRNNGHKFAMDIPNINDVFTKRKRKKINLIEKE